MAKKRQILFSRLIMEIKYEFGHVYLDRCGQILVDIEKHCLGWVAGESTPTRGFLERPDKGFVAGFNSLKYDFSAQTPYNNSIEEIAEEASILWKIVHANLGVDEFFRIGCRFYYLIATKSKEESEKLIAKSELNVVLPDKIKDNFKPRTRQIVVVLCRNDMEYRLELTGITQAKTIDPSKLVTSEPRSLRKRQREALIQRARLAEAYEREPRFAVQFDIDCVRFEPESVSVEKFIFEQESVVREHFLPILEKL